jgi:hypothetical protein
VCHEISNRTLALFQAELQDSRDPACKTDSMQASSLANVITVCVELI